MSRKNQSVSDLPELFQMRYSLFPEMARWALDFKAVPHLRRSVLPGPHAPKIKRLAGQTCMPVLRQGEVLVRNSDNVLDAIEQQWPEPALYPADPAHRDKAVEIRDRFRHWGPHFRRAMFFALLSDKPYAAELFAQGYPETDKRRYRRMFFAVKPLMQISMGVTKKRAEASTLVVQEALDWLAENIGEQGYLVGDGFTVADLAAAAVVSLCSLSEGTSAAAPEPRPPELQAWVNRWVGHPAVNWAERIYRDHRPASAAVEDCAY